MSKKSSRLQQFRASAAALLSENDLPAEHRSSRWRRFVHFWGLVWRSFVRNRCPVRASALAYATLLALIPMLAVVMSITSSFLKQEGEARIDQFIEKVVATVTPAANVAMGDDNSLDPDEPDDKASTVSKSTLAADERVVAARKSIARKINQ